MEFPGFSVVAVIGALLGLSVASGILLIAASWTRPRTVAGAPRPATRGPWAARTESWGRAGRWGRAGSSGSSGRSGGSGRSDGSERTRLAIGCVAAALAGGAVTLAVTSVPMVTFIAGVACAWIPILVVRRRRRRLRDARRAAWPEAVDTLVSAVRAGLSLPEGLADLSRRGPSVLRPPFEAFESDLHSRGTLASALDRLQARLSDPVAGQVIAVVRMADDVGGSSLSSVLRALSASLRQDAAVRADIAARQSWTVVSARVAVAAPWLTLALLCTRPESAAAYRSLAGAVIVAVTAALSLAAYLLMLRIARLPEAASA
jgi:tight adherence protein B